MKVKLAELTDDEVQVLRMEDLVGDEGGGIVQLPCLISGEVQSTECDGVARS